MFQVVTRALLICLISGNGIANSVPESCDGLDAIASSSSLQCQRSNDCLYLDCNITLFIGYGAKVELLPCDQPPAIEIFLKTPSGESKLGKFDSSQPPSTRAIPLDGGAEFQFIVSWISIQTVTITGRLVNSGTGEVFQTIVEPTNVTLPPCTPNDEPATTCEALRHIANDTDLECDTSEGDDCDTMKCDTVLNSFPITTTYKVLPCNDPPAIRVVVEAAGTTVVDKVVSESQEISVVANLVTANVTLDQLDTSIGFQVYVVTRDWDGYIFEYTKIPIDKTQCKATDGESGASNVHMMSALLLLPTLSTLSYLLS